MVSLRNVRNTKCSSCEEPLPTKDLLLMFVTYRYLCKACGRKKILTIGSSVSLTAVGMFYMWFLIENMGVNFFLSALLALPFLGGLAIVCGRFQDSIR